MQTITFPYSDSFMPQTRRTTLQNLCRKRIATLIPSLRITARFERTVIRLVQRNLDNGRFERFASYRSRQKPLAIANYVDIMVYHVSRELDRVDALEKGDVQAWHELYRLLEQRADRMILRLRDARTASQQAPEFANETCAIIFENRYPFDISFDAWATTILNRLILARYTRSTDILDRQGPFASLDDPPRSNQDGFSLGESLPDGQSLAPFDKIENLMFLQDTLAHLQSAQQRKVIEYTYLDELDDETIAKRMGKSKQSIYNLRNRALIRLKHIFQK